jgi:hypothetical protein
MVSGIVSMKVVMVMFMFMIIAMSSVMMIVMGRAYIWSHEYKGQKNG